MRSGRELILASLNSHGGRGADDPLLRSVDTHRRDTLIAQGDPADPNLYKWDIFLQGENETVFFEL